MANKYFEVSRLRSENKFQWLNNFLKFLILIPSNSSGSYGIDIVLEILNITLKQSLHYHPQHVPWLRLEGDLEFRKPN